MTSKRCKMWRFFSSGKDEWSFTPKWHDSILRIKNINEIDKGYTDGWTEQANNDLVTFGEWAHWTKEKAKEVGREVPGYIWSMAEEQ